MKLIVGLGNPGTQYQNTRHNAGFFVADALVKRHALAGPKVKFQAESYEGPVAGEKVLLLKPQTFMNRSGQSVGEAAKFFKVEPEDVLVLVDDIALPCGQIRLRGSGSAGGHNGLKDIERVLTTPEYPRLRIGVDPPGKAPQVDYVLGKFSPRQLPKIDFAVERACDAVESWISEGLDKAMTVHNSRGEKPEW